MTIITKQKNLMISLSKLGGSEGDLYHSCLPMCEFKNGRPDLERTHIKQSWINTGLQDLDKNNNTSRYAAFSIKK